MKPRFDQARPGQWSSLQAVTQLQSVSRILLGLGGGGAWRRLGGGVAACDMLSCSVWTLDGGGVNITYWGTPELSSLEGASPSPRAHQLLSRGWDHASVSLETTRDHKRSQEKITPLPLNSICALVTQLHIRTPQTMFTLYSLHCADTTDSNTEQLCRQFWIKSQQILYAYLKDILRCVLNRPLLPGIDQIVWAVTISITLKLDKKEEVCHGQVMFPVTVCAGACSLSAELYYSVLSQSTIYSPISKFPNKYRSFWLGLGLGA